MVNGALRFCFRATQHTWYQAPFRFFEGGPPVRTFSSMCSLSRLVILFVAAVTFLATDQVFAQPANIPSGFQIVLDGSVRMINKDVQQADGTLERWAIMYDP